MTYETFLKLTLELQRQERIVDDLYKNKIDLLEFIDPYHGLIHLLIKEIYGEEGVDWFSWFCYENDYGRGGLEAWDADKNPIFYSLDSLWEYLEKLRQES